MATLSLSMGSQMLVIFVCVGCVYRIGNRLAIGDCYTILPVVTTDHSISSASALLLRVSVTSQRFLPNSKTNKKSLI